MRDRFYKVGVLALLVLCAALWLGSDVIKASSGRLLCETLDCSGTVGATSLTATGAVTGATFAGGIGGAVVASTVTVNNTTTVADVTGLTFTVVNGGKYVVTCDFYIVTTAAADARFNFAAPTVSASAVMGMGGENAGSINRLYANSGALTVNNNDLCMNSLGTDNIVHIIVTFTATEAGTFQVQFAQLSAQAVNTQILAGSCMTWQRVN